MYKEQYRIDLCILASGKPKKFSYAIRSSDVLLRRFLGICSALEAEMRALLLAMQQARRLHVEKILIYTNTHSFDFQRSPRAGDSLRSLFEELSKERAHFTEIEIFLEESAKYWSELEEFIRSSR